MELHNLYSATNIIRLIKLRRMRLTEHVARMGEERKLCSVLVGNSDGKRPIGRPRRRWDDGIFGTLGWGRGMGPMADCCECGDGPSGSGATKLILKFFQPYFTNTRVL
jgi:hypothetical protein